MPWHADCQSDPAEIFDRFLLDGAPSTEPAKPILQHRPGAIVDAQGKPLLVLQPAPHFASMGLATPVLLMSDERPVDHQNIPYVANCDFILKPETIVPGSYLSHKVYPIGRRDFRVRDTTHCDGYLRLHKGEVEIVTSRLGHNHERWAINPHSWTISKAKMDDLTYIGPWMWEIEISDSTLICRTIHPYDGPE